MKHQSPSSSLVGCRTARHWIRVGREPLPGHVDARRASERLVPDGCARSVWRSVCDRCRRPLAAAAVAREVRVAVLAPDGLPVDGLLAVRTRALMARPDCRDRRVAVLAPHRLGEHLLLAERTLAHSCTLVGCAHRGAPGLGLMPYVYRFSAPARACISDCPVVVYAARAIGVGAPSRCRIRCAGAARR